MRYHVVLIESDEGYAESCPQLRGYHSQGSTVEEAFENIKEAIREWLSVQAQQRPRPKIVEIIMRVAPALDRRVTDGTATQDHR